MAAVVIQATDIGFHSAILYRMSDDEPTFSLFHVKWHKRLGYEGGWPIDSPGLWVVPQALDDHLQTVAMLCRGIARRIRSGLPLRIPYSLRYDPKVRFRHPNGELELGDESGLSCATFVLAMFASAGIQLVKAETWPPRPGEDMVFVDKLDPLVQRIPGGPSVVRRLRSELEPGVVRIRPDEMFGACIVNNHPTTFADARRGAEQMRQKLDAAAPPPSQPPPVPMPT